MGAIKALLPVGGRALLLRHLDALVAVGLTPLVVLGAHAAALRSELPLGTRTVTNPDWARTDARTSLRLALSTLPPSTRVLITPVDAPPAPAEVLRALLHARGAAVPHCDGREGHPVTGVADALHHGLATATLRACLADAARVSVSWPHLQRNLNTPADWASWRQADAPDAVVHPTSRGSQDSG